MNRPAITLTPAQEGFEIQNQNRFTIPWPVDTSLVSIGAGMPGENQTSGTDLEGTRTMSKVPRLPPTRRPALPRVGLARSLLILNSVLKRSIIKLYIVPMQEYAEPPKWRRIFNACLAGLSSIIGADMALAWGWHFILDRQRNLPGEEPATPELASVANILIYGLGMVLAFVLARWQWKRSAKSTKIHENLMTGAWLLLCILLLTRPRF